MTSDETEESLEAIPLDEFCGHCGSGLTLHTTAAQRAGYGWWAFDGDRVTCEGCDHIIWVSADEGAGYIRTDWNCGCAACMRWWDDEITS